MREAKFTMTKFLQLQALKAQTPEEKFEELKLKCVWRVNNKHMKKCDNKQNKTYSCDLKNCPFRGENFVVNKNGNK